MADWEVRISVYRNGRRVKIIGALGDTALDALTTAHNDLELWAQDPPRRSRSYRGQAFDNTPRTGYRPKTEGADRG